MTRIINSAVRWQKHFTGVLHVASRGVAEKDQTGLVKYEQGQSHYSCVNLGYSF